MFDSLLNNDFYRAHRTVLWIIGIGLLIRGIASAVIPAGFDEAYYGVYTFYPSMGFYDHPPLVALTAGLGLWITGIYSVFTLRLGALLLFPFTAWLVYKLTSDIYDKKVATLSVLFFHLTPYFMFGMGAFVIPDNSLGLFWMLTLLSVWRVHKSDAPQWLIAVGFFSALAMMAKYHAIFLPFGVFTLLLFLPQWRKYWKSVWLYAGFALFILGFLPNLMWNANNDWITLANQFGKSTSGGLNISFSSFMQGILVQAAYLLPWQMYVLIAGTVVVIRGGSDNEKWLIPFIIFPILAFTVIGATRTILPHWPMPGYLAAMIFAGKWLSTVSQRTKNLLIRMSGIIASILILFIIFQTITGLVPMGKKADLTLDGQGWSEVADYLEKNHISESEDIFIFSHKWFTGGELAFAAAGRFPVTVINNASPHGFAYWLPADNYTGKTGIYVTTERYNRDPEKHYKDAFRHYTFLDTIRTYKLGKEVQMFFIWQCDSLQPGYPIPYGPHKNR